MRFKVVHTTRFKYRHPASESFAEMRVWPRDDAHQKVLARQVEIDPQVRIYDYIDYFGNHVEFFTVPFRHNALSIRATAEVETFPAAPLDAVLETCIGEARQIYNSRMLKLWEFLQPGKRVPFGLLRGDSGVRGFFREGVPLGEALRGLNAWIHENFTYNPDVTDIDTPLARVVAKRQGVCQDFAHLMLSILRSHGLPARYVSGYIEAHDPDKTDPGLVGSAASHAWVEVFLPGGTWWGLDPTNNQAAGERHVKTAVGRDYEDVAPTRGTYKGARDQKLQVMVSLKRKPSLTHKADHVPIEN